MKKVQTTVILMKALFFYWFLYVKKLMYENELTPPPPLWNFSIKNIPFFQMMASLSMKSWTLCGQPSFLNPLKVTDCTERGRHGCMVNGRCQPQILLRSNSSERTPPSVMHTWSHTFACWLLKEDILWRENCFSGKIEKKRKTFKFAKPMLSCCIVRFLEARSSHYGWSCDSPHWPSEQPCIVIDIGKVLTESIHVWT